MAFLAAAGQGQDSGSVLINPGVPWPATDALGRELPLTAEVGPPKKDRFVGIFYLPWTGDEFSYGPYDVSKILAEQPDMRTTPFFRHTGPKQWHYAFWGEPLFGYYKLTDPWVIRRHMHMLADAGSRFVHSPKISSRVFWRLAPGRPRAQVMAAGKFFRAWGGATATVAVVRAAAERNLPAAWAAAVASFPAQT